MKYEDSSRDRPEERQGSHGAQRSQAPAPGKVTRTSKLSSRREPAVQRKATRPGTARSSVVRSSGDFTDDVYMDMAHRGSTALSEQAPVQARGHIDADPDAVHGAASAGVSGAGSGLPHADRIQASFGPAHDVTGVRTHVGGAAREASERIGAEAYATGNHIAFRSQPDLHTAAHEAAHVVQQRAGVQLANGVGQAGDAYERQADAVADRVVRGESAEALLSGTSGSGATEAVQRREVPDRTSIKSPGDWMTADRLTLAGTFETANLHNLGTSDTSQYVQIEERRDFYRWFHQYTAARGYTTRWALAASLVANGAHQVAHMNPILEAGARLVGTVSDELQGMMRIGNQVIFDNVFPKLKLLLDRGPVTDPAAGLRWDMEVLSQEQSLIQPLYASVAPSTISQLEGIARQSGFANIGAWITNGARVPAGRHNNAGDMPEFGGSSILNVDDRLAYGMQVGNQFTPGGTGYNPATHSRPAPGSSYTDRTELNTVNVRPNLHMLDAVLDVPVDADPTRILSLLRALTPREQDELLADRSPDGRRYSARLGECSFDTIALARMIVEVPSMTTDIPSIVGGYTSGAAHQPAFLASYNAEVTRMRGLVRAMQSMPSPGPFGF